MSGYLLFSIVIPIIFRQVGPVAAGKYGFTMGLINAVAGASGSWSRTKLPKYGMLVAQEDWVSLRTLWRKATVHSLLFAALGSVAMITIMTVVSPFWPQLEQRYAGALIATLLSACMVMQNYVNSCAYILRAFKKEPYMWLSVTGAILNAVLIWFFTRQWGITGSAVGFMLCNLIILYPANSIFRTKQLQFMNGVSLIGRSKHQQAWKP